MRTILGLVFLGAVPILLAQTPAVTEGGVINAASFATNQAVTPGSLVSIFGSELAGSLVQADTIPLTAQLSNVSVTFNNVPAPLLFVSGGQINAQLPWNVLPAGTTVGTASVVVTRGGVASAPKTVQVGPFSPGIFAANYGIGPAIAINLDGTLAAAPGAVPGLTTHPAPRETIVIILATGLGAVDIPVANGHDSKDQIRRTTTVPAVLFGGAAAPQVDFSGLTPQFPGVNQLNVKIPANAPVGNSVPLQLQMGGITSTNQVTIAIQ